jgi:hypothetical protein
MLRSDGRCPGQMDPPGLDLDHEQDIQAGQADRLHREEVRRQRAGGLRTEELHPLRPTGTAWRWFQPVATQDGTVALDDSGRGQGRWSMLRRCTLRLRVPASAFAGFRFAPEVIVLAVRWYLRYNLSYRTWKSCWPGAESSSIT